MANYLTALLVALWGLSASAEFVAIEKLSASPEKYLGQTVTTRGHVSSATIEHDFGYLKLNLMNAGAPQIILEKSSPLYETVATDLPEGYDVTVTGTLEVFSNNGEPFIRATAYQRNFSFWSWLSSGVGPILILVAAVVGIPSIISALGSSGSTPEEKGQNKAA